MTSPKAYLRLLLDSSKAITASLDPNEVLDLIVTSIPAVVDVDAATIRLLDPAGRKLVLKAASGLSDTYLNRGPVDAEQGVLEALAGTPIAIVDAATDPRIDYPEEARAEGIHSILVAPIPIRGRVAGVLRLLTRTRRAFTPQEIEFAAALAEQCGIAIENARNHEDLRRQLAYFKAVCEVGKTISSTRILDEVLELIVTRVPQVMGVKACTIRLVGTTRGQLELKAAHGLSRTYLERGPLDDEMATYFIMEGEPVVIPDATTDIHSLYHEAAAREGVGSVLAVPISSQGEPIGMMRLLSAEQRFFSSADVSFAMAVAEQSGIAIQNAIDYQKLQELLDKCRGS